MTLTSDAGANPDAIGLWCRIEMADGTVARIALMHPNGEIVASYPADHFEAELVRRMRTGHIQARLLPAESGGARRLVFENQGGEVVFAETLPLGAWK